LVYFLEIIVMAKNTSILLGDYFDKFINSQVHSGSYSSASEVIRAALRMFEKEENKQKKELSLLKGKVTFDLL